ncbi:hypothetical protein U1Q18_034238 [Sarracenia purpurea var. burkii]
MDGVAGKSGGGGAEASAAGRRVRCHDLVLRLLGLAFTLVAAVVGGVNKETQLVAVTMLETLPPLRIPVTAKWYYMSAFVYFVVSNAIACSYAAASLLLSMMSTTTHNGIIILLLLILDLVTVALLFSANGAATAVGVLGLNGNSHLNWNKVCYMFETFCHRSIAAMVMSMLGSFIFLWLVVLAALDLLKKSK